jgi:hypothetical protein
MKFPQVPSGGARRRPSENRGDGGDLESDVVGRNRVIMKKLADALEENEEGNRTPPDVAKELYQHPRVSELNPGDVAKETEEGIKDALPED